MPNRHKTWTQAGPTGHVYRYGYGILFENSFWPSPGLSHGFVTDVLGNHQGDNGLVIDKHYSEFLTLSGRYQTADYLLEVTDLVPDWYLGEKSHLSGAVNLPALNTEAIKRTNPSRGGPVDIGVFIGELRELPKLIKDLGDFFITRNLPRNPREGLRRGASAYLQGQFGWAPLISDLAGMLDVHDMVEKRFQELRSHQSNPKGFRQMTSLGTDELETGAQEVNLSSHSFGLIRGFQTSRSVDRKWAQVFWRPLVGHQVQSDRQLREQARRAVAGLRFDAATAWNLIPWTWLLDWFGNVGDVLEAARNDAGYYCDGVLIMRSIETTYSIQRKPSAPTEQASYIQGGSGSYHHVSRYRWMQAPNFLPTVDVPIISARQALTLGSLGVQRFFR